MEYLLLDIKVNPMEPFRDLLMYRLSEAGFDMFEDTEAGLKAYAPFHLYEPELVVSVLDEIRELGCLLASEEVRIPWKNWNEEWEKNYTPEIIADKIYVRADFHPPNPGFPIEILIQPRMAFGTGHHPTTSQVMEMMLTMDFREKKVIDMGCGTGILAILAIRLGAASAIAIDNDPNAAENSRDNVLKNHAEGILILEGDSSSLKGKYCDLFIANINRNIILNDLPLYRNSIRDGGQLITSGYYLEDLPVIRQCAAKYGFAYREHTVDQEWCCARFDLE